MCIAFGEAEPKAMLVGGLIPSKGVLAHISLCSYLLRHRWAVPHAGRKGSHFK